MSLSLVGVAESIHGGVSVSIYGAEGISAPDYPPMTLDAAVGISGVGSLSLFLNATLTLGAAVSSASTAEL